MWLHSTDGVQVNSGMSVSSHKLIRTCDEANEVTCVCISFSSKTLHQYNSCVLHMDGSWMLSLQIKKPSKQMVNTYRIKI